ncbi:MAG TPA: hypothetical protein VIU63_05995, partial [Nitrospira sp.]
MIIRWWLHAAAAIMNCMKPTILEPVRVRCTHDVARRVRKVLPLAVIGWSLIGFCPSGFAGQADVAPANPTKVRKIVAAGFGFQNADSSIITVKTYDADSGEVLSNESYDLDIKEDGPAVAGQSHERIFAGGVGIGADGLSEFTLRVYDAVDGRFLWEGRLNLGVSGGEVDTVPVVASLQPRATVSRISSRSHADGQPQFLLRVLNAETGQLVWADQFSTERSTARVERINLTASTAPRDIDFRIQMFEENGRQLLWEDHIIPAVEGSAASSEPHEEEAALIPRWS